MDEKDKEVAEAYEEGLMIVVGLAAEPGQQAEEEDAGPSQKEDDRPEFSARISAKASSSFVASPIARRADDEDDEEFEMRSQQEEAGHVQQQ